MTLLFLIPFLFLGHHGAYALNTPCCARVKEQPAEKELKVQLYYESLCPLSRETYARLVNVVQRLDKYITVETFPHGFAMLSGDDKLTFDCHHGPVECHINKLHACSVELLHNMTAAVLYNGCVLAHTNTAGEGHSNAAHNCGKWLGVDSKAIMKCAKSEQGSLLLKHHGEQTRRNNVPLVPYVFIFNGRANATNDPYGRHLFTTVCNSFKIKPAECGK